MPPETAIHTGLTETRVFSPTEEFRSHAHIGSLAEYERITSEARENPEAFWAGIAGELHWFKPWDKVLEWELPFAKWFVGGQINISYNCLDRHVAGWRKNKAAILWEGEPGDTRTLTYRQLLAGGVEVRQRAKVAGREKGRSRRDLHGHGAGAGHRAAGLRAHRRAAHRYLRRFFVAVADRSDQRLRRGGGGHAGCRLPARRGGQAERGRGCAPGRNVPPIKNVRGLQAHRIARSRCRPAGTIGGTN